ncbi:MAG: polymer-forming cytoskeletal protein [Pseudomonadales bacterium]|jgi:cytoskeletal protein CcmA (bactofilin family)|nr:polymer-forming cytoskeletal protein [Pseudomonadales bacterium]
MALFNGKSKSSGSMNANAGYITLISKATELNGDVHFSGALEIEGKVCGNIYAALDAEAAQVRVCESGLVRGEIRAPRVIINGRVEGDVHVSGHLELAAKAKVQGNVYYALIEMVMGAEVNGVLHHVPAAELKQLTDQSPAPKAAEEAAASA